MIAYLDTPSGISGDIFLGCLIDAGWSVERLRVAIGLLKLPAGEYSIDAISVMKGPLRATLADIGQTVAEIFGGRLKVGESFLANISA